MVSEPLLELPDDKALYDTPDPGALPEGWNALPGSPAAAAITLPAKHIEKKPTVASALPTLNSGLPCLLPLPPNLMSPVRWQLWRTTCLLIVGMSNVASSAKGDNDLSNDRVRCIRKAGRWLTSRS